MLFLKLFVGQAKCHQGVILIVCSAVGVHTLFGTALSAMYVVRP